MPKHYLFFDLDGTLTDPALGITNSIMYALKQFAIEVARREDLYVFIGPPLFASFQKYYHFDDAKADQAVTLYREYFAKQGLYENTPYPHIHDTLKTLKDMGYQLAVATSKPEPFARTILEHFELAAYFDVISGSDINDRQESKADVIKRALDRLGNPPRETCLMIGDREHDAIGAKANQMDCLGVTYGYGSREELLQAGCVDVVDDNQDLPEKIQKM